jgi:hypothetical protein
MALGPCPACGGTFAPKPADPAAQVCGGCGATFTVASPAALPPSRWGQWNLIAHLGVIAALGLWTVRVSHSEAVADLGENMGPLMIFGFLCYATLTSLLVMLARTRRFSVAFVHAPAVVYVAWLAAGPALAPVRTWYAEATKPEPIAIPGMLTVNGWRVYRTHGNSGYAALEVGATFEGRLVVESFEALRGDTVVGHVDVSRQPSLHHGVTMMAFPFILDAPDSPRRFRVSLLAYPSRIERPCRIGENGVGKGETPIQRLVFDTDAAKGTTKLGTQPHECGPLDTVSYRLMTPSSYPEGQ